MYERNLQGGCYNYGPRHSGKEKKGPRGLDDHPGVRIRNCSTRLGLSQLVMRLVCLYRQFVEPLISKNLLQTLRTCSLTLFPS